MLGGGFQNLLVQELGRGRDGAQGARFRFKVRGLKPIRIGEVEGSTVLGPLSRRLLGLGVYGHGNGASGILG